MYVVRTSCAVSEVQSRIGWQAKAPAPPRGTDAFVCQQEGSMSFLTQSQRTLLQGVSRLGYANPFLPERVELERAVLGGEFIEGELVWSYRAEHPEPRANVWRIVARLEPLVEQLGARLRTGVSAREPELALYEDAALQLLYPVSYTHLTLPTNRAVSITV